MAEERRPQGGIGGHGTPARLGEAPVALLGGDGPARHFVDAGAEQQEPDASQPQASQPAALSQCLKARRYLTREKKRETN